MATMPTTTASRRPASPGLLTRAHLPLVIGAVSLVTLGAFENRATLTVLPTIARDLDGLWLFGAAAAAPLIAYVVSTVVGGIWSDRRGPVPTLHAGLALFAASQLVLGLAPSMLVFAAARVGSGLAEGLLDIGLTVLVARAVPEALRPKVFAAFAAAWVLPSLLGPSIAGAVTELVHWRAVFLLGVVLLAPAVLALRPSMRAATAAAPSATTSTAGRWTTSERRSVVLSLAVAAALVAVTGGGALLSRHDVLSLAGAALTVVATVALVPLLGTLLPPGTLRFAHGIPTIVALRGLVATAFGASGAFLPLMLSAVHGYGPTAAGLSLTVTGLCWAAGSQLHGLRVVQARSTAPLRLRVGFALIAGGLVGPALVSLEAMPVAAGLVLWGVAGVGMGVVSPTLSTQLLALSPVDAQGRNTAASSLTGSVTQAVALALVGAVIAWQAPALPGELFAAVMLGCGVVAVTGLVTARRAA